MHKLVVHYGLKMGERPAKAEENLMNAQYNCVLYDGSDYKCTELLCNVKAPGCHSATKTARKYLPPRKAMRRLKRGFFIRSLFSFYHPLTTNH